MYILAGKNDFKNVTVTYTDTQNIYVIKNYQVRVIKETIKEISENVADTTTLHSSTV